MNFDPMNSGPVNSGLTTSAAQEPAHERARTMLVLSGSERPGQAELSHAERSWLAAHLGSCPSCREFADNSQATIRALRSIPITATVSLVSTTQLRVRQRAQELQRQQERFWVVCACCAAVTLSTVLTTAVLWRGFAWIGQQTRLSAPVWQGGFVVFYLMPAVLVGILLLAQGTFLADHNGSYRD